MCPPQLDWFASLQHHCMCTTPKRNYYPESKLSQLKLSILTRKLIFYKYSVYLFNFSLLFYLFKFDFCSLINIRDVIYIWKIFEWENLFTIYSIVLLWNTPGMSSSKIIYTTGLG